MHSSGRTIILIAGRYQAKIVSVGAAIAELTHCGRHLVIAHKPEEMPLAHMGKVLVPWPNRVADGRYEHDGKVFNLPVNDPVSHSAIHGLLAWRDWQVCDQCANSVTLSVFLPPSYGYPFALVCNVIYRLDADTGLSASIITRNIGDKPAPYGAGAHPYLTCNLEKIDGCTLTMPATDLFSVDTLQPVANALDFSTTREIGSTQIDHTFKARTAPAPWEVRITSIQQAMTTWLRASQPWLQIYTGDKLQRLGLAIEPMSCPPNAFNSGVDLFFLAPEETHNLAFSIGCD